MQYINPAMAPSPVIGSQEAVCSSLSGGDITLPGPEGTHSMCAIQTFSSFSSCDLLLDTRPIDTNKEAIRNN